VDWYDPSLDSGTGVLNRADVEALYQSLWGTKPEIQLPETDGDEDLKAVAEVLTPITVQDIQGRLRRLKKSTAAGLDGIKVDYVRSRAAKEVLRLLFTLILCTGTQPAAWRMNRTVLIPKEGKDARRAENYRPITISSVLSRIYWGIFDQRLRQHVRFTPRQKGFVAEAGCFNNVHIPN